MQDGAIVFGTEIITIGAAIFLSNRAIHLGVS